nr:ankyrin repeat, PH and SEC7 domain containing protein secG-like [Lytechinus pictus]
MTLERSLLTECRNKKIGNLTKKRQRSNRFRRHTNNNYASPHLVVNLSSSPLSQAETPLLSKGLEFCPTPPEVEQIALSQDLSTFYRRIRLKEFFLDEPPSDPEPFYRKSTWTPPKNRVPSLETYIQAVSSQVCSTDTLYTRAHDNLPREERQALSSLKNRSDIIIKPADKGSAVVVMDRQQYIDEAMKHLNNRSHYALLDSDPTYFLRKLNDIKDQIPETAIIGTLDVSSLYTNIPHDEAKDGNVQLVKELVEMGDDVNEANGIGVTPLYVAAHLGLKDLVEYLLKNGAIIDIKTKVTGTPPLHEASSGGHLDVVKYLVDQGAQANTADNEGVTPLHWASLYGHLDVVKYLIDQGAQANTANNAGGTPLHRASSGGHLDVVKYLIGEGALVDKASNNGTTPLHFASGRGHLEVVKCLIGVGAEVDKAAIHDQTSLSMAYAMGHLDVVKYLIDQGAQFDEPDASGIVFLMRASWDGNLDLVKHIVRQGAQINKADLNDMTSLINSSSQGHLDVVKHLIDHGAQIDKADARGWTPLHHASYHGHLHVVEYLIDHGAQIDKTNKGGETAIHAASRGGHINIVRYLKSEQARLGAGSKDYEKVTNDHIKNLSGLLGINHFEPICKGIGFDPKRGQDILEEKHSDYSASYQVMLNTWKDGKSTKDIDDLLEKAGIKLVSSYKK